MTTSSADCQRYYSFSKKIPKDVKRYCGMCRQHNLVVETKGHNCTFKNCNCPRCSIVKQRRRIMKIQIRLRRAQEKRFQRIVEPKDVNLVSQNHPQIVVHGDYIASDEGIFNDKNTCYFCQKCKNHGVLMWKKDHKRSCIYSKCECEQCILIETRRKLDQYLKSSQNSRGVIEYGVWSASSRKENYSRTKDKLDHKTMHNISECRIAANMKERLLDTSSFLNVGKQYSLLQNAPVTNSTLFGTHLDLPTNLNSFMLQMVPFGTIFFPPQSACTNSITRFQQSQCTGSKLNSFLTELPKQIYSDLSIYASLLNRAESYSLSDTLKVLF